MRTLYPDIEPYWTHELPREVLKNGQQHRIYIEQCGNPNGIPVVFLHGGPGSGCRPQHRRYFNPEHYRIILFDQRGCGRSTPLGELENNTTADLIDDMEAIRQLLGIDRWLLFGGSWGATLALCYAIRHPQRVLSLVLRGTFLGRQQDIDWVYAQGGASALFPEAWQSLIEILPAAEHATPLQAYFDLLTSDNEQQQMDAAMRLNCWEATIVTLRDHHFVADIDAGPGPLAHSRIQLHYALNQCFIAETPILSHIDALRAIPTHVIHGRYDVVCPVQQSWQLQRAWPNIKLCILPLAGHAAGEDTVIDALVDTTDALIKELTV